MQHYRKCLSCLHRESLERSKVYGSIKRSWNGVTHHIEMDIKNNVRNTQTDIGGCKNLFASA